MQYFNEDMGELFQKASAGIRLRPADDDWNKIQKKLLPENIVLPFTETKEYSHSQNSTRLRVIASFIFGMFAVTAVVLTDHRIKKIEFGQQPGHPQTSGSGRKAADEYDKFGQKPKSGFFLPSFLRIISKTPARMNPSEVQHWSLFKPASQEQMTPVDFQVKSVPANTIHAARLETPSKVMVTQTGKQKDTVSEKGIYGGVIAGTQFSRTKQQGFGHAGLSAGLILGFHLTKRLSAETGFVISDKQFSSAGKYFDMSKISASMPPGMKLIQIQSKSTVLEIPLEIKYDIFKTGRGSFFAAGGISSFIITRENNQYQASVNGNNETLKGSYSTHQHYFAAAANISAGYEWKAGKGLNLRLEPYVQIPLKTVGMGSMQVVSAGAYLGITFPIIK